MEESDDIIEANPVLSLTVIVAVGAVAYAAVSFVMRQTVEPVEVGLFAVVFAGVYVGFAVYSETIKSLVGSR